MKEKVIVFFCDIRGTYCSSDEPQRHFKILKTMELLEKMNKQMNCEKVIFSFLTDDHDPSLIKMCLDELKHFSNESIVFGKQFYFDGYLYNNIKYDHKSDIKGKKMENYVHELWDKYHVEKVIFADDAKFYTNTAKMFFDKARRPFEYHLINVTNGLQSVISELDYLTDELSTKEKNNIKKYKKY